MITFQNVTKHYDNGSVVVDGLSLVAPGAKLRYLSALRAVEKPPHCG
jgi:ABC-type ATPase involved in cell division